MLYVKEIELKFRKRPAVGIEGAGVLKPEDVCDLVRDIRDSAVEKMIALHLDSRNKINFLQTVSIGTVNSAPVSPAEIVRVSLLTGSVGVILVHNHPSGDTSPSQDDRNITGRVKATLALLEISLLDHIIVSDSGFYSFKEHSEI
ncbi:MAG: JAB domain-containing protein [Candidatus Ratteibacteria bacterium]|jgi:DNA repair protein RadC